MNQVRTYIGLGGNVGDAEDTLAAAIHALAALPGTQLRAVSRLYVTAPVGLAGQPDFRNAVAALDVPAGPDPETGAIALLVALKGLERAFGRQRRRRWGPRELDLDLIAFGDERIAVERPPEGFSLAEVPAEEGVSLLVVPHPEAGQRLFVLAPWADLAPDLVPPGWAETVDETRARREQIEGGEAVTPVGEWHGRAWRATT